jgi:integrase
MSDRLFKRGAIYHCWYYGRHGEQQRVSTKCTSRRAAESVLRRLEEQARAQADGTAHKTATATLREVVDAYLTAAEKSDRAEKTMDSYYCKGGHLLRVLGEDTDINALPNSVEDDYVEARRREGASDHTIHKELVVLRASLKRAAKKGLFHRSLEAIRADDFSAGYVPRRTFLTVPQFNLLLGCLAERRKATVAFLVYCAARDSEWQRVERHHVDLDGTLILPGTKTEGAHREIPLRDHGPLRALLDHALEVMPDEQRYLFPAWSNIRRDLHEACDRVKAKLLAEADKLAVNGRKKEAAALKREVELFPMVSPNDLRRTFGTWCRVQGMPTDRIAVLLGHADSRMVERVYGRIDARQLGPELGRVFGALDLPAITVPSTAADCDSRVIDACTTLANMTSMTKAKSSKIVEVQCPGSELNQRHADFQASPQHDLRP